MTAATAAPAKAPTMLLSAPSTTHPTTDEVHEAGSRIDPWPTSSLDERHDTLSTLSSSLSLVLQIASTSLYRLSSTQHIQINPGIPPHTHLHATGAAQGADGLIPPAQVAEDVKEMSEDLMDRIKWMKEEIGKMRPEKTEQEHQAALTALDKELVHVNAEFEEALAEADELQKEIDALLLQSCS